LKHYYGLSSSLPQDIDTIANIISVHRSRISQLQRAGRDRIIYHLSAIKQLLGSDSLEALTVDSGLAFMRRIESFREGCIAHTTKEDRARQNEERRELKCVLDFVYMADTERPAFYNFYGISSLPPKSIRQTAEKLGGKFNSIARLIANARRRVRINSRGVLYRGIPARSKRLSQQRTASSDKKPFPLTPGSVSKDEDAGKSSSSGNSDSHRFKRRVRKRGERYSYDQQLDTHLYTGRGTNDDGQPNRSASTIYDHANTLLGENRLKAAAGLFLASGEKYLGAGKAKLAVRSFIASSNAYLKAKKYHSALKAQKRVIESVQKLDDLESLIISYITLGIIYSKMQRYSDAVKAFEKAVDDGKTCPSKRIYASALVHLGITCYCMSDYAKASYYYERSARIFQDDLQDPTEAARSWYKSALNRGLVENFDASGEHAETAGSLAASVGCIALAYLSYALAGESFGSCLQRDRSATNKASAQRIVDDLVDAIVDRTAGKIPSRDMVDAHIEELYPKAYYSLSNEEISVFTQIVFNTLFPESDPGANEASLDEKDMESKGDSKASSAGKSRHGRSKTDRVSRNYAKRKDDDLYENDEGFKGRKRRSKRTKDGQARKGGSRTVQKRASPVEMIEKGIALEKAGDTAAAIELYLRAAEENIRKKNYISAQTGFIRAASALRKRGDLEEAADAQTSDIECKLKVETGAEDLHTSYLTLGIIYEEMKEFEMAVEAFTIAMEIAQEYRPSQDYANVLLHLSQCSEKERDHRVAADFAKKSGREYYVNAEKTVDKKESQEIFDKAAYAWTACAINLRILGEFAESGDISLQVADAREQAGYPEKACLPYLHAAVSYHTKELWDKKEESIEQARISFRLIIIKQIQTLGSDRPPRSALEELIIEEYPSLFEKGLKRYASVLLEEELGRIYADREALEWQATREGDAKASSAGKRRKESKYSASAREGKRGAEARDRSRGFEGYDDGRYDEDDEYPRYTESRASRDRKDASRKNNNRAFKLESEAGELVEAGNRAAAASKYLGAGDAFLDHGSYTIASNCYLRAASILRSIDGRLEDAAEAQTLSIECKLQVRPIQDKELPTQWVEGLIIGYIGLGQIYQLMDEHEMAVEAFEEAASKAQEYGFKQRYASAHVAISNTYYQLNEIESAAGSSQIAAKAFYEAAQESSDDTRERYYGEAARSYSSLAKYLWILEKFSESADASSMAANADEQSGNPAEACVSCVYAITAYDQSEQEDKKAEHLRKANRLMSLALEEMVDKLKPAKPVRGELTLQFKTEHPNMFDKRRRKYGLQILEQELDRLFSGEGSSSNSDPASGLKTSSAGDNSWQNRRKRRRAKTRIHNRDRHHRNDGMDSPGLLRVQPTPKYANMNPKQLFARARILVERKNAKEAIEYFLEAASLNNKERDFYSAGICFYEALQLLKSESAKADHRGKKRVNKAINRRISGVRLQALEAFEAAVAKRMGEFDKEYAVAYRRLGELYDEIGKHAAAANRFRISATVYQSFVKDPRKAARMLGKSANNYREDENYFRAGVASWKAARLRESFDDLPMAFKSYTHSFMDYSYMTEQDMRKRMRYSEQDAKRLLWRFVHNVASSTTNKPSTEELYNSVINKYKVIFEGRTKDHALGFLRKVAADYLSDPPESSEDKAKASSAGRKPKKNKRKDKKKDEQKKKQREKEQKGKENQAGRKILDINARMKSGNKPKRIYEEFLEAISDPNYWRSLKRNKGLKVVREQVSSSLDLLKSSDSSIDSMQAFVNARSEILDNSDSTHVGSLIASYYKAIRWFKAAREHRVTLKHDDQQERPTFVLFYTMSLNLLTKLDFVPTGISYIASALYERGINVEIMPLQMGMFPDLSDKEYAQGLKNGIRPHFGEEIVLKGIYELVDSDNMNIGISADEVNYRRHIKTIQVVNRISTATKIFVGGPKPTIDLKNTALELMENIRTLGNSYGDSPGASVVFAGEAEKALPELVWDLDGIDAQDTVPDDLQDALSRKYEGTIISLGGERVECSPEIVNRIPQAELDDTVSFNPLIQERKKTVYYASKRGCPWASNQDHACGFCSRVVDGLRVHSARKVASDLSGVGELINHKSREAQQKSALRPLEPIEGVSDASRLMAEEIAPYYALYLEGIQIPDTRDLPESLTLSARNNINLWREAQSTGDPESYNIAGPLRDAFEYATDARIKIAICQRLLELSARDRKGLVFIDDDYMPHLPQSAEFMDEFMGNAATLSSALGFTVAQLQIDSLGGRSDEVDDELMKRFVDAGASIEVGIESCDDEELGPERFNKGFDWDHIQSKLRILNTYGIPIRINLICSNQHTTPFNLLNSLTRYARLLAELENVVVFNVNVYVIPLINTALRESLTEDDAVRYYNAEAGGRDYTYSILETPLYEAILPRNKAVKSALAKHEDSLIGIFDKIGEKPEVAFRLLSTAVDLADEVRRSKTEADQEAFKLWQERIEGLLPVLETRVGEDERWGKVYQLLKASADRATTSKASSAGSTSGKYSRTRQADWGEEPDGDNYGSGYPEGTTRRENQTMSSGSIKRWTELKARVEQEEEDLMNVEITIDVEGLSALAAQLLRRGEEFATLASPFHAKHYFVQAAEVLARLGRDQEAEKARSKALRCSKRDDRPGMGKVKSSSGGAPAEAVLDTTDRREKLIDTLDKIDDLPFGVTNPRLADDVYRAIEADIDLISILLGRVLTTEDGDDNKGLLYYAFYGTMHLKEIVLSDEEFILLLDKLAEDRDCFYNEVEFLAKAVGLAVKNREDLLPVLFKKCATLEDTDIVGKLTVALSTALNSSKTLKLTPDQFVTLLKRLKGEDDEDRLSVIYVSLAKDPTLSTLLIENLDIFVAKDASPSVEIEIEPEHKDDLSNLTDLINNREELKKLLAFLSIL
ncbi:tetratricopeptide repeat protein, partial [Candidatus Omnitrophota bacterium]